MKLLIALLLILALNTYAIFTNVAKADETGMHDTENAEALDSAEVPSGADAADAAEMAKKLANPLAAMISLPMQLNYDQDFGVATLAVRSRLLSPLAIMLESPPAQSSTPATSAVRWQNSGVTTYLRMPLASSTVRTVTAT